MYAEEIVNEVVNYNAVIYYVVIISLLMPFTEEAEGMVMLGLCVVIVGVTLLWNYTPLTMYVSVCIGEVLNILLYSRLSGYKAYMLTYLATLSITLNFMVWVDDYANVLYIHYEDLNILLLEATLVILTFSTLNFKIKAP